MPDKVYCYPGSDVLVNKLNIKDGKELFEAEKELTYIRLKELQDHPVEGNFDFTHLRKIHRYIFQDLYNWAGEVRTVEIGKGNLFCTTPCIPSYADSIFRKFYRQCNDKKKDKEQFVMALAENYGDLNALHPFREGNGRTQREFARLICLKCGYAFDLSVTTHEEMLRASKLSFDKCDTSLLCRIFEKAVVPEKIYLTKDDNSLRILTSDDLTIDGGSDTYDYYSYGQYEHIQYYNAKYQEKINEMKIF